MEGWCRLASQRCCITFCSLHGAVYPSLVSLESAHQGCGVLVLNVRFGRGSDTVADLLDDGVETQLCSNIQHEKDADHQCHRNLPSKNTVHYHETGSFNWNWNVMDGNWNTVVLRNLQKVLDKGPITAKGLRCHRNSLAIVGYSRDMCPKSPKNVSHCIKYLEKTL